MRKADKFKPQELSNIVYSYWKSENANTDPLLMDLRNTILSRLHTFRPVELCQVLMAYTESGMLDDAMLEAFEA